MLWSKVANEAATWCCTSALRDSKTVADRFEHEGFSFLTITLADFGKDFHKSLDQGYVDRHLFAGFKRRGELPVFLRGFLDRVFDRSSGVLLDEPCVDSIRAIRQLTLMYSKIHLPCSDARVRRAIREFVECEQDIRTLDAEGRPFMDDFLRLSELLFRRVFSRADLRVFVGYTLPKHGPGSVAERLTSNGKYDCLDWTARLESVFPRGEMLIPSPAFESRLEQARVLEPRDETPMRIVSVPKTLKTPRIIGIEPTAGQYVQQGLKEVIEEGLQRDNLLWNLLGNRDQTPNQVLARVGSLYGDLATLDLSEASDRVSNQLVRGMLANYPALADGVEACRSRKADVPGHGVIRLAKFAPMGSSLTFPIESMVFLTLVLIGIEQATNTRLTRKAIHRLKGRVRIYGDDIIVPVEYVRSVVGVLEAFGFRVNSRKSFWTGKFRESCGKEYYDGQDVTIVKVRHVFPSQRRHATQVNSLVDFRNQLYKAGYWTTCKSLDDHLRRMLRHYPVVAPSSRVLGRHSFLGYESEKLHPSLFSPLVRGWVLVGEPPSDPLDGAGALLKFFLKRGGLPSVDREHLRRAGRPKRVDIKLRYASPF